MKNKNKIGQFVNYFEAEIDKVSNVKNPLYKKILFSCMLDTLGIARFPNHNTDQRMISFLLDCTKRSELNRVSLVQLSLFLNYSLSSQERKATQLLQFALQELSKMQAGHVYRGHDVDPYYNQLDKKATSKEKKILKLARYVNLFYAYRNAMVHEFKKPGYGMELSDDGSSPYYHSDMNKQWQLVFPASFFQTLCTEALTGLRKYLEDKDINPYNSYELCDMWVKTKKLNKIINT